MVLNTGNSECNFIGGKLCHARYYTLKYTDFENKTAKVDVEALVQKFLIQILPAIWYLLVPSF